MWKKRLAALMLAGAAFVAMPACSSDDAAEKDAKEAGKQIEDEAGEVKKDVDKEVKD
jgi:hypothetical protein